MENPWSAYWKGIRARRDEWRPILESEIKTWSAMSPEQILSRLPTRNECHEREFNGKKYQVEVDVLENTEEYVHVSVSVDDGTLPASLSPVSSSFICTKASGSRAGGK
jgi:hypothetical protein